MRYISVTKYLLRSGHHIDVILQQGVEVGHMEIVELGLVRKHEEGGPGLGEAPGEADPLLPETGDEDIKRSSHFEARCQHGSMSGLAVGLWLQLH